MNELVPQSDSPPSLRIALHLELPDCPAARELCIDHLQLLTSGKRGISRVHLHNGNGQPPVLCIHYDPAVTSLAQVQRLAQHAGARVVEDYAHAVLPLHAIEGEDASRRIENALRQVPGVISASVNLAGQRARVEFDLQRVTLQRIQQALDQLGYQPRPQRDIGGLLRRLWGNKELLWSLLAGLVLAVAWIGDSFLAMPEPVVLSLYLASYVLGGFDLVRRTFVSVLQRAFTFDIDLLMLLAAVGAALLGHYAEGAFLLFLFSLANALEHYALGRARNAIRALADLAPAVARVRRDGTEQQVPVEQVRVDEPVIVLPAERIPIDGQILSGNSAVDQAPITGESVPVDKSPGDEVFAGTINGEGSLEIRTTRAAGDRTLDRVIKLVEEAQTQKAPTQRFTERFERIFVPGVLIVDLLVIVLPPLMGWWTWNTSFYRGMALLVGASPCALALGAPSAVLAGIAQAARRGVLIKGGVYLESLGTIKSLALDKTGTLTVGRPQVTDLLPQPDVSEEQLLRIAAAVETRSQHPLAQAVVRAAQSRRLELPESGDLQSVTARGVRAAVDGQVVEIGSLRLWEGQEVPAEIHDSISRLRQLGRSTMAVRMGQRWLGVIGLADQPRAGVREVLEQLRAMNISPLVMLTGDHRQVGEAVAREVGVDTVRADLLPEQKVDAVRELVAAHGSVAMVGDGVNDAPALATATVGIAMGGAGTAAALETADVALMGDDLSKLPFAIALSRRARRIIAQNLVIALGVMAMLIVGSIAGWLRIGPAVVFHEGSTIVVIFNALRLLAFNGPASAQPASRSPPATPTAPRDRLPGMSVPAEH